MSDDDQTSIPPSFIALFQSAGRGRPSASRAEIQSRHEFCEDLALAMAEPAKATLFDLGITEADVLERCHRGLLEPSAGVAPSEASWVVCRLAELLDWPIPALGMPTNPG